jgi:hypothetical protein
MGIFQSPHRELDRDRLAVRGGGTGDAQNFLIPAVQNAKVSLIRSTGRDIEWDWREGLSGPYRNDRLISSRGSDQLDGGNRAGSLEDTIQVVRGHSLINGERGERRHYGKRDDRAAKGG